MYNKNPKNFGNRKGEGDPLLCLKKLLCFGEGVWEVLLGVVGKERWGGDVRVRRPASFQLGQDDEVPEESGNVEGDHRCLDITQRQLLWWEVEHWDEIYDERRSWGDLSRESQRNLTKLLGRG